MAMWTCDFEDCGRPSVRTDGGCILCDCHLCSKHLGAEYHQCPNWEDESSYDPSAREAEKKEVTDLLKRINVCAILSRASHLREGIPCSIPQPQPLRYDRFNATSPPPDLQAYIMRSEVATLEFLRKTKIPAPRVFDYNLELANPVGVRYILMEKLPGKSLRWSSTTTKEQREKIIRQLADTYIELETFPFDFMGSLDQPGTDHVGPFAREFLTDYVDSRMQTRGPFTSREEYIVATLQLTLDFIIRGEAYANRAINAFLIHRFLLDSVQRILLHYKTDRRFYLKHADDKGDHILVDNDYNITGIVDWEWAYTDSRSAAFNSPVLLLPVAEFYDGLNHPADNELALAQSLEDKGHPNLAETVRNGRILHLYEFCCGYDLADWEGFLGLFRCLRKAMNVDGDLGWEDWRGKALEQYKYDDRLKELMSRDSTV